MRDEVEGMREGVGVTAYLVNESRARRPGLAQDPLAAAWIPDADRPAVRELWDGFAAAVYPHDDLVVALRGRYVADLLADALRDDPDTVLAVCGAGFSSYPWLLPFTAAIEVDLPHMAEAKRRRAAELTAAGILPRRDVAHLGADLSEPVDRGTVAGAVRKLADGRPVAYVVEGVLFYLPPEQAEAVLTLGAEFGDTSLTAASYWPAAAAGSQVLAAQRDWFGRRAIPADASYLTHHQLAGLLGEPVRDVGPEDLQRHYLGRVEVAEAGLIPEYVAASGRVAAGPMASGAMTSAGSLAAAGSVAAGPVVTGPARAAGSVFAAGAVPSARGVAP
jgi:O-methyltransferase involved in polyketide biosynthesis